MKITPAKLLLTAILSLSLLSTDVLEAQGAPTTSDYIFWLIPNDDCLAGGLVTVELWLEILPSAPAAGVLQGFSVGVCHDETLLNLPPSSAAVTMGSWVDNLQPCPGPDFLAISAYDGTGASAAGFTIETVFSFIGGCTLPVGCHHISTTEYSCLDGFDFSNSVISICDGLSNPPISTIVVVSGVSYVPEQALLPDSITLNCVETAPGQLELNWTNTAAFNSFDIVCEGVVIATLPGSASSYLHLCDPAFSNCCSVVGTTSCGFTFETEPCCCGGGEPCLEIIEEPTLECNPNGSGHILTIDFINLSGLTVHKAVIPGEVTTSSGTATVLDNVIAFDPEIQNGAADTFSVRITQAVAGDSITVPFALMHKNDDGSVEECCSDEVVIEVPPCDQEFIRCDNNRDGGCDIGDAVFLLAFLFSGGDPCSCEDACDCNDDGAINIADAIFKLDYLFSSGSPPPSPHPLCGPDPTPDSLDCQSFPPCP